MHERTWRMAESLGGRADTKKATAYAPTLAEQPRQKPRRSRMDFFQRCIASRDTPTAACSAAFVALAESWGHGKCQRLFFRSPGARQARLLCSVANALVFSTMAVQMRRYLRIPVAGTAVDLADRHLFVARAPRRPWKSDRASLCSAIAHTICSAASRDAIEPPAHGSRRRDMARLALPRLVGPSLMICTGISRPGWD